MFKRLTMLLALAAGWGSLESNAVEATNQAVVVDLKLDDYLQQVVHHNEAVQAQMLETEVSRRKHKAEGGIFEPQLIASAMREANRRTNNIQQQAAQSGEGFFNERNDVYETAVEQGLPTGGKIRLGYTLSDLGNNINPLSGLGVTTTNGVWTKQYQTFVGLTLVQPLLKDGGLTPTLAALRLSALESDIAFQEYRRTLMMSLFRAADAYWGLYYSQEQVRFLDQSVSVAQNVLDDSREKLKAGHGSELDVMEAQSALALRNTKRNEALQSFYDSLSSLKTYAGVSTSFFQDGMNPEVWHAADVPRETSPEISYATCLERATAMNPDYLIQLKKADQEGLRLDVAKNQLLPNLNLKTAYGFNGLASEPGTSWEMAMDSQFPSWSVGLEFSIPLGINIKGHNLSEAAKLSLKEAEIQLKAVMTQLANGINTTIQKVAGWQQSIQSYQMIIHYNEELLKTQLERLKAGRVEARKVLEDEASLLDSRQNLANALMQYQHALLQVELSEGSLLKNRNLEISREELKQSTRKLVKSLND